jgi:Uma2 family endonuclease
MSRTALIEPPIGPGSRFPMSYEDFWNWEPEFKAEWVDGEVIVFMAPLLRHNELLIFLVRLLGGFVDTYELGRVFAAELGMDLPRRPSVRLPDVLVVLHEHEARLKREGLMGPADFVFELISEDSVTNDRRDKFREYEQAGVPEYLMADTRPGKERFDYYRLDANGRYQPVAPDERGRYHSTVLPGFWLDPAWLWQDPLPTVERLLFEIASDAYLHRLMRLRESARDR